jgi:gas vesicle protein GvpG
MRLLAELLMLPVTGPVRGLRFIAEQVQAEMDAALMDRAQLERELISLSLRHDLGQISGDEYEAEEAYLLEQLEAILAYEEAVAREQQDAYDWDEVDEMIALGEQVDESAEQDEEG